MRVSRDALWQLRPDLELLPADGGDGGPALLVHDPATGGFDRVEWPECDLLRTLRSSGTADDIASRVAAASTLRPGPADVLEYLVELGKRGWLRGDRFWPSRFRERRKAGLTALAARCLFIPVRLFNPENFLRATKTLARALVNPLTLSLLLLCGLAGAYLALPRWEEYWQASLGSLGRGRTASFILALIAVKTVHEFAHAYTAALAGARVTGMGVAFFFFMPLPFTDVTDAWRLPWPRRLRVASAGMLAELAIAGATLLLWALSPPGEAAAVLARLSSVAVLSTLLTNLNPGPRFDGYYILVCLLRLENLRSRAQEELRRIAMARVLGVRGADCGERLAGWRRAAVLAYAGYAFLYRISLGAGLILLAYRFLPKAVGAPLALLEAWLFFGQPLAGAALSLTRNVRHMRPTRWLFALLLCFAAAGVWFFGAWPRRLRFHAVTRAAVEEAVRTQRNGEVAAVRAKRGDRIVAGEELARLDAPADGPLMRRAEWALVEAEMSEEQAWRGDASRREAGRRAAEAGRRRVELEALDHRRTYLTVTSPAGGVLAHWDESAVVGVSVPRGRLLGWVVDAPVDTLSCYADMATAGRLEAGADALFLPDSGEEGIRGKIVRIDASRPEFLEDPHLAGALGAAPQRNGGYALPVPYAKVTVQLDREAGRVGQTGVVWTRGRPESLAKRAWLWLKDLAVRESAF